MQIWKKAVVANLKNEKNFTTAVKDTHLESDIRSLFLRWMFLFLVRESIVFWLHVICNPKMPKKCGKN